MGRTLRASVVVLAAVVLVASCTVSKTERPPLAGPSELSLALTLLANPDVLAQDGASQSQVVIQARDANGLAVKNLAVHLDNLGCGTTANVGMLSSRDLVTGADGRATASYTAPTAAANCEPNNAWVTLQVMPVGSDYRSATPRTVDIRLVPPAP